MAMRPRGGRAGPNREQRFVVGRVYEPFKPMSEWRQEEDYDTLLVYLPGFQKEYIKVTTEDLNIVRVRGERLVAENKWSRFQEDFRVPENCEMRGIRARFDGGILTITMPRKTITIPSPPPPPPTTRVAPKSTQLAPDQSTQVAPKSEKPPPTIRVAPKSTQVSPPKPEETKTKQQQTWVQKLKDEEDNSTSSESEKNAEKPALEGGMSTQSQPKPIPMPTKQEAADGDESIVPTKNKGKSKEEENKMMGLESRRKVGELSKGGKLVEEVKGGNNISNGWKGGLNEDRKMVVNMGVGVLVILALGIHVSYTIGLIGKGKTN